MAAGGFKEFVAGETLDQDEINDFLMQGMLVFAGTAARGSAITAPVEGQFSFLKDSDSVEFYDGSAWVELSAGIASAKISNTPTGQFTDGNGFTWDYVEFTGNGTLTVTEAGYIDCLVVGGGGQSMANTQSAGGGSGGVRYGLVYFAAGSHSVVVAAGSGDSGDSFFGNAGNPSQIGSVLQVGGGEGAISRTSSVTINSTNNFSRDNSGGGSHSGKWASGVSGSEVGAGAGGTLYGSNRQDGVTLNYTGSNVEYGRGGSSASARANRGDGGDYDSNGQGSSGVVIVKVLA